MRGFDMSEVLLDPDLTDGFIYYRRPYTIGTNGRAVITNSNPITAYGVITAASSNDLQRLDDYQTSTRYMSVVTQEHLQMLAPASNGNSGFQPDLITWRGTNYIVKSCDPYPQFGPGFFQAIIASIDLVDVAL